MNLVLIGLRGAGKTSVGPLVARQLSRVFIDLDDVTARLLGATSPAEAWKRHGEPAFRGAEVRALREVLAADDRVVALGGGTPTAPGAEALLSGEQAAGRAVVVYLRAMPGALRARLAPTDLALRPSLTGADPLAEIEAVFAARDPLYQGTADEVIETGGKEPDAIAAEVAEAFSRHRPAGPRGRRPRSAQGP